MTRGSGPRPAGRDPHHAGDLPFRATPAAVAYDGLSRVPVCLLLDNVRSAYNTGAFFRTADNAGVDELILAGFTPRPPHRSLAKTALGAETAVRWRAVARAIDAIEGLRARDYEVAAIETDARAVDLFDWVPRFPVCVVFGHEVDGLDAAVRGACDTRVRLPTLGAKGSLNVATAGGVVCYELLRKYRGLLVARSERDRARRCRSSVVGRRQARP
jgi:tRNA G18 (ribose-2'-O)-methylase SpoU